MLGPVKSFLALRTIFGLPLHRHNLSAFLVFNMANNNIVYNYFQIIVKLLV